jgi:hypothetical protein
VSDARVRIGILGPARIAPHTVIAPSRLHTRASVTCVAARDATRAGICHRSTIADLPRGAEHRWTCGGKAE